MDWMFQVQIRESELIGWLRAPVSAQAPAMIRPDSRADGKGHDAGDH